MAAKTWIAGTGTWGNGLNWSPTGFAGASDDAAIAGPATITGSGSANSVTVAGSLSISGYYAAGTLAVGTASTAGAMTLSSGSFVATTATILFGPLQVTSASAKLTVTGQLTLGGTRSVSSYQANTLVASGGGSAQVGSVLMTGTPNNGIAVADVSSKVEIGSAGGTALGTITVDSGKTIAGEGSLSAPNGIVNAGTITAQGGTLSIGGAVSGAGLLQIAANSTLYLWTAPSSQNVSFAGAGGQLEVVPTATTGTPVLTETGIIGGFAPGDTILYAGSALVSNVAYSANGANIGTLTLHNGASVLGTLTLAGNYTGYVFQVTPNPGGYGTLISVVGPAAGGGGGGPGTDAFTWIASSGSWTAAADWQDSTTHVNGLAVPGSANAVLLNGPSSAAVTITGPGASSSLATVGNVSLNGAYTTGALSVGSTTQLGGVWLAAGATLAATSANIVFGSLQENGAGAKLNVSGTLTLGGSRASGTASYVADMVSLTNGAAAQVGGVALLASPGGNSVNVDNTSSLEIGTAGYATPGTLTVDSGGVLQGIGLVVATGGIINNGTIGAEGGGALQIGSAIAGAGQLMIGTNATLSIYNGASTQPVAFAGANGTLEITPTSTGALSETGAISGFAPGDTILFASSTPVTTVNYTAGANGAGTLALIDGAATIGTLSVSGDFTDEWFEVAPNGAYGTAITVVPQYPSPDPLFNSAWYLQQYPSVAASGVDPYQDYMTVGWKAGRNPDPFFNTTYYLNQNPDVAAAGVNPLTHFETSGWKEGRDPSILFSDAGYLAANADVKAAGIDPLLHYVEFGEAEGRAITAATPHAVGTPDPLVNYAYYYAQHPDIAAQGIDASVSYNTVGWKLGYNPDPYFDTNYYLTQNPDVKAAGVDPLTHYETNGWKEGRAPSLVFNGNSYLAANPDVAAADVDPLLHYINDGINQGRIGFLTGQGTAPDPLVNTVYYDTQLGATLFPTGAAGQAEATASYNSYGWQHGLNPDSLFNTNYYLQQNPDVAASGLNPLLHYETMGWKEGRNPSPQFSTNKYLAANPDVKAAGFDPLWHYMLDGQAEGRAIYPV